MTEPGDVLVSIVNHHHADLLPLCLDSVGPASTGLTVHVTVLDNASPDGSTEMVRRRYPAVELIAQDRANGFAANQNAIIGPRLADARYVLLLNDDACLTEGALSAMVAFMDANPTVGIAAPRLVYPDGSPQSSVRGVPAGAGRGAQPLGCRPPGTQGVAEAECLPSAAAWSSPATDDARLPRELG